MLKHEPYIAFLGRAVRDIFAVALDNAGIRILQAGDDSQQRGFARAGGAQQRDERAAFNFQVHVVDGAKRAKLFRQVANGNAHVKVVLKFPFLGSSGHD